MFPHKAMINANGDTVRYSKCGEAKEIAMEVLMVKAPIFFPSFTSTFAANWIMVTKSIRGSPKLLAHFGHFFCGTIFHGCFLFFWGGDIIEE